MELAHFNSFCSVTAQEKILLLTDMQKNRNSTHLNKGNGDDNNNCLQVKNDNDITECKTYSFQQSQ